MLNQSGCPEIKLKSKRVCPVCDKTLGKKNKSGFCNRHRDRTGKNNPFYGKHHSKETIKLLRERCSKSSHEKWKDPVYMKEYWRKGIIVKNDNCSCNISEMEKKFFEELNEVLPYIGRKTVEKGAKWFFPDGIDDRVGVIIEFYGGYWHANPLLYEANDIVHHSIHAKDIWEKDAKRIQELEMMGYKVLIVWESEYKEDSKGVIENLDSFLNWDSCVF